MKKLFTKFSVLFILLFISSCAKEGINDPANSQMSELELSTSFQEILESEDFINLYEKIFEFALNYDSEEIENIKRLSIDFEDFLNMNEGDLKKINIELSPEFCNFFYELEETTQLLKADYPEILNDKKNIALFQQFVIENSTDLEIVKKNKRIAKSCESDLKACVNAADTKLATRTAVATAAAAIGLPLATAAIIVIAIVDHRDEVQQCNADYIDCSTN